METLTLYLRLGWQHIVSPDALDHQLFLLALSATLTIHESRKLLILITAFTLGHCLTLALGATGLVRIPSYWIEILIPASIGMVALGNFRSVVPSKTTVKQVINYPITALFGLLHGLGFANTLHAMLGREQSLMLPLFGFNLGIEVGQLAVLAVVLGVQTACMWLLKISLPLWTAFVSGLALAGSVWMVINRF